MKESLLHSHQAEEYVTAKDGIKLFLKSWFPEDVFKNVVIVAHGLGTHSGYYQRLGQDLSSCGNLVCAFDRRGHGLSEGARGDIVSFRTDVRDLREVSRYLKAKYQSKNVFLFGESLGATIGLWYASGFPDGLSGLILCAPAVKLGLRLTSIDTVRPLPRFFLAALPHLLTLNIRGQVPAPFLFEIVSSNDEFIHRLKNDELVNHTASLRYGAKMLALMRHATKFASKIKIPTLILQGEEDKLLNPLGARAVYKAIPNQQKRIVLFPGAFHMLLYDPVTPRVLKEVKNWLESCVR